jgi:hypothetical protein
MAPLGHRVLLFLNAKTAYNLIVSRTLKMLEYFERQEISRQLWDQLDKARVQHMAASERFSLLTKESLGCLPAPDGALSIQQAGADSRLALRHYMTALKRFSDFTLYGTLPEDLD